MSTRQLLLASANGAMSSPVVSAAAWSRIRPRRRNLACGKVLARRADLETVMRRLTLCLCLVLVATSASAANVVQLVVTDRVSPSEQRIESEAAKAQVGDDAFQSRILAAERRVTASICAGCFTGAAHRPSRAATHVHAKTVTTPVETDEDLR